jgi:hypothetical protein
MPTNGGGLRSTERQRTIREYLNSKVPGAGDIYWGILVALENKDNPEFIAHAAHSGRELIDKLQRSFPGVPSTVPQSLASSVVADYVAFLDSHPTPEERAAKDAELRAWNDIARATSTQRNELLLETADQGASHDKATKSAAARDLRRYDKWLNGVAHHHISTTKEEFVVNLQRFEAVLEVLLFDYFDVEARVSTYIETTEPSAADGEELRYLLAKSSLQVFFFRTVKNPKWLPILRDAGFFALPVDILKHPDGAVSCPSWPQTEYLKECAADQPEDITAILLAAPITDNARVQQEFVEVALQLPAQNAAQLVPKAKKWIQGPYHTITNLPLKLAELVAKLAMEGQSSSAFTLAKAILDVRVDEKELLRQEKALGYSFPPKPDSYVREYVYKEMLSKCRVGLEAADSDRYLALLCEMLNKALRLEAKFRKGENERDIDYTYITRPAIEDADESSSDPVVDILITAIRNAMQRMVDGGTSIETITAMLRGYKFPIFRRLEFYLLSGNAKAALPQLPEIFRQVEFFGDEPWKHEFNLLLEAGFDKVSLEDRTPYLDWINKGPDLVEVRESIQSVRHREMTNEEEVEFVERWKLRQLTPVRSGLDETRSRELDALEQKYGPRESDLAFKKGTTWVGPTSPLDAEQLSLMMPKQVIEYLTSWRPSSDHYSPSPEGLGRFLGDDVAARSKEYAELLEANLATTIRPVYLFYIFHGLEAAVKNVLDLNWENILNLSDAIVYADGLPEPDKSSDGFETGWKGVQKQIASLVSEAMQRHDGPPFQHRDRIWKLLNKLSELQDPDLAFEAQYGGTNMSPVDMSVNTGRGEAAHAVFRYALWVDRCLNRGKVEAEQNHTLPPELLPVLERFLDPHQEPTLTIRAVVGWYIQSLVFLDLEWTVKKLPLILPTEESGVALREAALEGYFAFNQPNGFLLRNIRPLFELGLGWALSNPGEKTFHDARGRCLEHILNFYWWGIEPLHGEGSLVARLFAGPVNVRAKAIDFIGRTMKRLHPVAKGGPEALSRLSELIQWRIQECRAGKHPQNELAEELREFGWWFTYSNQDKQWLIDTLNQVLELTGGTLEWSHGVLERLEDFAADFPEETARAVSLIIRGDASPWNLDYWSPRLRKLFEALIKSGNQKAVDSMEGALHYLGENGVRDFRDLINEIRSMKGAAKSKEASGANPRGEG